jgi:glycosyltransferase involved in cell wall biosynthesis
MTRSGELRSVGINAIFLEPQLGGLATYVYELVPQLARLAPGLRLRIYCNPDGAAELRRRGLGDVAELSVHPVLGRHGLRAVSELTALGALAGRQVDLVHSVAMTGPLATRAAHVVTVADVIWIVEPRPDRAATMRLWRTVIPRVARRADRVIAISQDAATQITRHLGVPPDRIDTILLGRGNGARVAPTAADVVRGRHGIGQGRIVLTVSGKSVHKNLMRFVEAAPAVLAAHPDAVFVLPGAPTAYEDELRATAARLGLGDRIAFPGFVSDEDLEGLYADATVFAMPSTTEGFGLPILEAMDRGVPVACSNASALPEVAGDAGLLFDPYAVPDIAATVARLLGDAALRARLAAAGRARAATFTWERTAEQTLESYARALHARRAR